ncbi:MAG: serine dehydratase [Ectothiorhodospiraceae bacterium]|nr:serine dehydratase [Ectothiorhodospiraceae bacterium]
MTLPTLAEIEGAAERIAPFAHRTPTLTNTYLNAVTDATLYFKCENFQKVGAFKFRGATNAVFSLTDMEAAHGVATHSSGNHAQALALAAANRGIPAYIIMPKNAPQVKIDAVCGYGAEITFCEPTLAARESTLDTVVQRTGAAFIHPYNNWKIIAGQATAARELHMDIPELDIVMAPVGGGGLLSGTALSTSFLVPACKVIAAEPKNADDAKRSFEAGAIIPSENPNTICDGLLTSLGDKTFSIISRHVHDILTATEESIIRAMKMIWERMKIVVEPSSAVPLAVILEHGERFAGKRVGIILSGGNVDLTKLPWREGNAV